MQFIKAAEKKTRSARANILVPQLFGRYGRLPNKFFLLLNLHETWHLCRQPRLQSDCCQNHTTNWTSQEGARLVAFTFYTHPPFVLSALLGRPCLCPICHFIKGLPCKHRLFPCAFEFYYFLQGAGYCVIIDIRVFKIGLRNTPAITRYSLFTSRHVCAPWRMQVSWGYANVNSYLKDHHHSPRITP